MTTDQIIRTILQDLINEIIATAIETVGTRGKHRYRRYRGRDRD